MNIFQKRKLEKTLKKLENKYITINSGGCGHFARELGDVLKTKGYDVKYVLLLSSENHIEYANKAISRGDMNTLNKASWAHVMINVDDKLIDVEGLCQAKYDKEKQVFIQKKKGGYGTYYGVTLPENTLHTWLKPKYDKNWNQTFDRGCIINIRKELQKSLVG